MEWRILLDKLINDSDFAYKVTLPGAVCAIFLLNPDSSITSDIDICVEIFWRRNCLAKYLQNYLPESDIIIHQSFGTASLRYKNYKLEFVATEKRNIILAVVIPKYNLETYWMMSWGGILLLMHYLCLLPQVKFWIFPVKDLAIWNKELFAQYKTRIKFFRRPFKDAKSTAIHLLYALIFK